MDPNKMMNGTYGMVWIDGEKLANIKQFECKAKMDYEDVKLAGELGTFGKYKGYAVEGTLTLHKIDSMLARKVNAGITKGVMPAITITASVDDPNNGTEKVQIDGVQFTELTLSKFEVGELIEEEAPFRASTYRFLEEI